jgi:hypothetical protein
MTSPFLPIWIALTITLTGCHSVKTRETQISDEMSTIIAKHKVRPWELSVSGLGAFNGDAVPIDTNDLELIRK